MAVYYEDLEIGHRWRSRAYRVEHDEMLAFSRAWDPRPYHVDEAWSADNMYGELIASGAYTMAVYLKLSSEAMAEWQVLTALGWEDVRFKAPVRAGDALTARSEIVGKERFRLRPGLGLVRSRQSVTNQADTTVMTFSSPFLIKMRSPEAAAGRRP